MKIINSKFSIKSRIWTAVSIPGIFSVALIVAAYFIIPTENLPIWSLLAALCCLIPMTYILGWWLNKSHKTSLDDINQIMHRVALGDLSMEISDAKTIEFDETFLYLEEIVGNLLAIEIASNEFVRGASQTPFLPVSEVDKLGVSFKKFLDKSRRLANSKHQDSVFDESLESLLIDISRMRRGELRSEIQTSSESLKPLARICSQIISDSNDLVYQIQSANVQADSSARETQIIADNLGQKGFMLEQGLVQADFKARELVVGTKIISDKLGESTQLALQSLERTKHGAVATQNSIAAMNRLRFQIHESMIRIKRFSERSTEINQIAKSIDDLSHRTGIVALNASIQAGSGGEGNRGFVAVAEEIESLAERSSEATKQISTLTKALQNETDEALESLEMVGREVANNHLLANDAGQILQELEIISDKYANSTQALNGVVHRQIQKSNEVSRVVSDAISDSQKTIESLKRAAENGNKIVSLTRELGSFVAKYRLPKKTDDVNISQPPTERFSNASNSLN